MTPNTALSQVIVDFIKLLGKNSALYKIATILRGPDQDDYSTDHTIKGVTTARIRGFLYGKLSSIDPIPGGAYRITALSPAEMQTRDAFLATCARRYFKHYTDAVAVIKEAFGYDLMKEVDLTLPKVAKVNQVEAKKVFTILELIWNNSALYNLIASLRSADTQQGSKNLSTVRLRDFLSAQMNGNGVGTPLSAGQIQERNEALAKESSHYQKYWNCACRTVAEIFGYDLINEKVI